MMKWIFAVVAMAACGPGGGTHCDNCGLNGIWLGANLAFRELDNTGVPALNQINDALGKRGLRICDVTMRGAPVALRVVGDEVSALSPEPGALPLRGAALVGLTIWLGIDDLRADDRSTVPPAQKRGTCTPAYKIAIDQAGCSPRNTDPVATPGECQTKSGFPVYRLVYEVLGSHARGVACEPAVPAQHPDLAIDGWAVLYNADRYTDIGLSWLHPYAPLTVQESGPADTWFNLACLSTSLAKMHARGHTWAGKHGALEPSVDEQQAMLKLLAADYCGNGKPFTENGVPIAYVWKRAGAPAPILDRPLEAVWTSDGGGARCIGTPRNAHYTQADVLAACAWVHACTPADWTMAGAYAASMTVPH